MKPIFIKLSPINTAFSYYVNFAQVEMMFQNEKEGGTTVMFVSSPAIKVKETPQQIFDMIRQLAQMENSLVANGYNFDD